MNREDIIRMAREAGWDDHHCQFDTRIERFAALVAAAEREGCANVVEADPSYDWHPFACEAAAAIRARGQV
jgi:hypothetical protein